MLRICKPSVVLIRYSIDGENIVAGAAKLTLSSKDMNTILSSIDDEQKEVWIKELIRRGHGSPLEHSVYSFEITCSRVTSHQIVRHRIASYTQLSQRRGDKLLKNVVNVSAEYLGVSIPNSISKQELYHKYSTILHEIIESIDEIDDDMLYNIVCQGFIIPPRVVRKNDKEFIKELLLCLEKYYKALANGYHPEDARFLLPQAVKTRIYVTMNARELIENFLPLRTCSHAQWEVRYIAWSMLHELLRVHPSIFSYAGPRCVLYENRVRGNSCSLLSFIKDNIDFIIERCPELVPRGNIRQCILSSLKDPWEDNYILFNEYLQNNDRKQ